MLDVLVTLLDRLKHGAHGLLVEQLLPYCAPSRERSLKPRSQHVNLVAIDAVLLAVDTQQFLQSRTEFAFSVRSRIVTAPHLLPVYVEQQFIWNCHGLKEEAVLFFIP